MTSEDFCSYLNEQIAIAEKNADPLLARRKEALRAFNELGVPTRRNEAWKYTDGMQFLQSPDTKAVETTSADIAKMADAACPERPDCYALYFLNGHFLTQLSDSAEVDGLTIESLAPSAISEEAKARLATSEILQEQAFARLNDIRFDSGVRITVGKNVQLDKPIVVYSLFTGAADGMMLYPRMLIELAEGASAEIVEMSYGSEETTAYSCFSVVECNVATNASLVQHVVNQHSLRAKVYRAVALEQGKDSRATLGVFNFGGSTVRNELYSKIAGENADSRLLGLNILNDKQHVDNHTLLDHAVPHCESFELFKGVYDDASKGIFDGTIIVRPDAQKTNAVQSNQSLLLSDTATSNAKPQLKIWADDVKCTHGATVGQLDDTALFYLRSRGVPVEEARAMLIHAFASEVISEVTIEFLRENLGSLLSAKLAKDA